MIATFYNERIDKNVVAYQKRVFDHFGISLNQVMPENWGTHGSAVNDYINSLGDSWEYFVLFDIDCIPLTRTVVQESIDWALSHTGILGVAQRANHIKDSILYAGPAFLVFSRKTFDLLGRPSFSGNSRSDNGGELTYECVSRGYEVNLLYPSHVEVPKWKLTDDSMFGLGTTFENKIFHNFESRNGRNHGFINKCEKVLKINQD
ncbi:hypothetical protein UFOVP699_276 [uncultured Caudovirales phage]|uniref:Uncharacterized protein n=1 Tax=uncultured Caudovirales phage TaxID=2100421 RepID=A0A6J5NIB1_9CAUD|nr:hypothetical protein UFOVP699_276 [uncultured Caudovirales phage]